MYKKIIASILSLMLLGLTACNPIEPNTSTTTIQEVEETFILNQDMKKDILNFSIDFFKQQLEDNQNTIVSPQSLYFALGMTINGACDNTQQEIKDTLCKSVDLKEFNSNISYLIQNTDTNTCKIANSIWINNINGLSLNKDFQNYSQKYFNSEIHIETFDDKFVNTVNKWVSKNTDGMIDSILNDTPNESMMYLINAICFKSKWAEEYEDTQINDNYTFTNSTGDRENVTMLSSNESTYISDNQATGFLKYYEGYKYAFMGILPNEGVSITEYVETLTGDSFSQLYRSKKSGDDIVVSVEIPEFTYSNDYNLNNTLQNMGIKSAFTNSADFSNMIDSQNYQLKIDKIIQKAFIQVDRNGTKASGVTSISMDNGIECITDQPQYFEVHLNRPFIYAIIDTNTEIPIFMGIVNSVNNN